MSHDGLHSHQWFSTSSMHEFRWSQTNVATGVHLRIQKDMPETNITRAKEQRERRQQPSTTKLGGVATWSWLGHARLMMLARRSGHTV